MINILLIKKSKAKQKNGNFIAEIAARIKGIGEKKNEDFFKSQSNGILYGDGFASYTGLIVILNKLNFINDNDYFILDFNHTKFKELEFENKLLNIELTKTIDTAK